MVRRRSIEPTEGGSAANAQPDRPARSSVMMDVARLAGVSHQTVSRVLNDHANVRPQTRERVLAAMAELDYQPNSAMAASTRSRVCGRTLACSLSTRDTV